MPTETENPAGAAAEGAEAQEADAQAQDTETEAEAAGDASTAEESARPEWLPEKFWDAEAKSPNFEALAKSYAELERARLERAKNAPAEYKLPKSFEGFENHIPAGQLKAVQELARTEGYSQRGFELLMETAFGNPAAGREALKQEFGDKLEETLAACRTFARTLGDHEEAVAALCSFPAGVKLLNAWRLASAEKPIPGGEGAGSPKKTEQELKAMMADPRYADFAKRDPAFVAEVERGFRELYGKTQIRTASGNPGEMVGQPVG